MDADWTPLHAASVVVLALLCLACTPRSDVAAITKQQIDHVTPKRDFVGPAPVRLEWTTGEGVDTYTVTVLTEIDSVVFQHAGTHGNTLEWPKEITLEPGTYFWRIVGLKDQRAVADSGRSAFVVTR